MVSTLACEDGWRDIYLGPNLPSGDIVAAVRGTGARALALSLVYPGDDPFIESELAFLRRHLPEDLPIFVGGRAADNYAEILKRIDGEICENLSEFREALARLRSMASA